MQPSPAPDIEADIRFLTTEEGGKNKSCRTGYTTVHDFGIESSFNDARHSFPDVNEVRPGDRVRSEMVFLAPELQKGRLYEGFGFTVQEGRKIVGHGRVTKILNEELRRR